MNQSMIMWYMVMNEYMKVALLSFYLSFYTCILPSERPKKEGLIEKKFKI